MGILYILTIILLGIAFMLFKKTDVKINFIKWLIIYTTVLLGYNVLLGMIIGLLNITAHIWLLAIINLIIAGLLSYKAIKNKDYQKYYVRKNDIIMLAAILLIFIIMFIKDLYIYNGDVTHLAVDSAIHYRAAKHYSDCLKIFINAEDKTFFNFNIMQTGAYINDGIFMNIMHEITKIDYCYLYQFFETIVLFLSGLALYAGFMDKVKTKRGFITTLCLFILYLYGYPYNSWIYGFSYLSVGLLMITSLIPIVECLYSSENYKSNFIITLIVLYSIGLIFSYCLFVPAVFAAICIYCFINDLLIKNEKTYLKIFKKKTLIVTGLLVLVTIAGIGYLFIPSFFIEGQTNLVDALKIDGAIYSGKFADFWPFIPFGIIYLFELIKRVKNKSLSYLDVFSVIGLGYTALIYIGNILGFVSVYYMLKLNYFFWIIVSIISIEMINLYIDEKIVRIDVMILFALYLAAIFVPFSVGDYLKLALILGLIIMPLRDMIKKYDLNKIRVAPYVYAICWTLFVFSWVLMKAGHVFSEEYKRSLPNLVGIYFSENCDQRKQIDLRQNMNKDEIEALLYAREEIPELAVSNLELITTNYYTRLWAVAMLEVSDPEIKYENVIQDTSMHSVDRALKENKTYVIRLSTRDALESQIFKEDLEEVKENENVELLFSNEYAYVAKIIK